MKSPRPPILILSSAVLVTAVLATVGLAGRQGQAAPAAATSTSANIATVVQRTLTSQLAVSGTLGYSGAYSVLNEASGHYTSLPAAGQVVHNGEVLYQVDGSPVILLYGSTPAYRALSEYESGPDVQQLNAGLVALGYATSAQLDPSSNSFRWWTLYAVERLQAHLGVAQTGSLSFGQVIFLPDAIRITSVQPVLGSPAQPGQALASATSTSRRVLVNLDAAQQSQVKTGDQVTITLPNNQTTPGTVTYVGTVATSQSSGGSTGGSSTPTVEVDIAPTDAAATGTLDAAPVQVSITTASAANVLAVPVTALLAVAGGGYQVEVIEPDGRHRMIDVTLGLFDDALGLVQVTGTGLEAGVQVVVAGT